MIDMLRRPIIDGLDRVIFMRSVLRDTKEHWRRKDFHSSQFENVLDPFVVLKPQSLLQLILCYILFLEGFQCQNPQPSHEACRRRGCG